MDDSERKIMIAKLRQDEQRREEAERARKEAERIRYGIERRRHEEKERNREEQERRQKEMDRYQALIQYQEAEKRRTETENLAGIRRHNSDLTSQSYSAYGTGRGYGSGGNHGNANPRDPQGQSARPLARRATIEPEVVETKSFWGKIITKFKG